MVRCHESRSLERNRKIARTHLLTQLDNRINGENSVEAQIKRENRRIQDINKSRSKERLEMKRKLK